MVGQEHVQSGEEEGQQEVGGVSVGGCRLGRGIKHEQI